MLAVAARLPLAALQAPKSLILFKILALIEQLQIGLAMLVSIRAIEFLLAPYSRALLERARKAGAVGEKFFEVEPGPALVRLISQAWFMHPEAKGYLKGTLYTLRYSGRAELEYLSPQIRTTALWLKHGQALTACFLKPPPGHVLHMEGATPYELAGSFLAICSASERSELEAVAGVTPCHSEVLIDFLLHPAFIDSQAPQAVLIPR